MDSQRRHIMFINCNTEEEFLHTIRGLVMRGLTFQANATTWTIELSGGY